MELTLALMMTIRDRADRRDVERQRITIEEPKPSVSEEFQHKPEPV